MVRIGLPKGNTLLHAYAFRRGPEGLIGVFFAETLLRIAPRNGRLHVRGRLDHPRQLAFAAGPGFHCRRRQGPPETPLGCFNKPSPVKSKPDDPQRQPDHLAEDLGKQTNVWSERFEVVLKLSELLWPIRQPDWTVSLLRRQ